MKRRGLKESGPLMALVVLVVFTAILNPRFLTAFNLQTLGKQIAIFGILAIGETFVIMSEGGPGEMVGFELRCSDIR